MLVAVLVLAGVVALLWKRLSDVMAQQARLSLQYRELRNAHETLERRWSALNNEARDAPPGGTVTPATAGSTHPNASTSTPRPTHHATQGSRP